MLKLRLFDLRWICDGGVHINPEQIDASDGVSD